MKKMKPYYNLLKSEINKFKLINGINIIKNNNYNNKIRLLKKMIDQIDFLHNIKIR